MLAQLAGWKVFSTIVGVVSIIFWVTLAIRAFTRNNEGQRRIMLGLICTNLTLVVLVCLRGNISPPTIYVQEVQPGVFLTDAGKMTKADIPQNVSTIYEYGDPTKSGYTVRWWRWVKLERVNMPYDWRIAEVHVVTYQTDKQLLLADKGVIDRPKITEQYIQHCLQDNWWRQEHPDKPQGEITFLETPPDNSGAGPRLHTLIFDR